MHPLSRSFFAVTLASHRALLAGLLAAGLAATPAMGQSRQATGSAAPASGGMTNDDVIALASAGLGDNVIMAKIHAAHSTTFDTSVNGLKSLKAAGVSPAVISYMIDPSAAPASPAAPAAAGSAAAGDPDDPQSAHSPGIYMLSAGADGKTHLVKLDHIMAKQHKTGGMWASGMTYGIVKAHSKVDVDGTAAMVHTADTKPVFYAYIPEDTNTFGGNTISVRDLTLIRFDVKPDMRELTTGSFSEWGSKTGADDKAKQGLDTEQLKTGIYKLSLNQPLEPGQYAFQHQNYGAFFDFGVTSGQ